MPVRIAVVRRSLKAKTLVRIQDGQQAVYQYEGVVAKSYFGNNWFESNTRLQAGS